MTNKVYLSYQEIETIEEFCDLTLLDVIFDSEYDNWSVSKSVFDQKIFGKENLVFVIEDTEGNLFGGFINSTINDIISISNKKKKKRR